MHRILNVIKNIRAFLTLSFVMVCGLASAQIQEGEYVEKIIAWIDDEIILKSEFDLTANQFKGAYKLGDLDNITCDVLETMVLNKLMVAKSKIDSVYVEPEQLEQELNRRIQQMFAQFGGDPETILKEYGKTLEELKAEIKPNLEEQLLIQKMQGKITADVNVTPKEVKYFYKQIPRDSLPKFSTQVEIGHIVRYPKASEAAKDATVRKLEELKKRIQAGESFGKLAKEFSEDPGSAKLNGELGFFKRGDLVPEYEAAALSMRPGELSEIVESQFGFHLIQLIERRGNEFNSRHILLKAPSSYMDMELERSLLDSVRALILKDSIDFSMAAFKNNEDEASKSTNGFITDYEGNYRITVEKLGTVYFTIEDMKPGEVSKPLSYVDEQGKSGVRIIYLKSLILPHVANLTDDYQELREAALSEKKNKIVDEWFNEVKDQVYVRVSEDFQACKILEN
jgi:peptidyl-prolyl cis-trans isomerase SurA